MARSLDMDAARAISGPTSMRMGPLMLTLLERNIAAIEKRMVLLTPVAEPAHWSFRNVTVDSGRHRRLLRDLQRLRGHVYLQDGAISAKDLSHDGCHRTPLDARSWHLLMLDRAGNVNGCIWYLKHDRDVTIDDLRVKTCPLATEQESQLKVRKAVEADLAQATADDLSYAEVGGWAMSADADCPAAGFLLAVGAYALCRFLGNAIGLTTATARHSSAGILRRLGLSHFVVDGETLPTYYDAKYGCEMELLRFDSRESNPRYQGAINLLQQRLSNLSVVAAVGAAMEAPAFAYRHEMAQAGCAA